MSAEQIRTHLRRTSESFVTPGGVKHQPLVDEFNEIACDTIRARNLRERVALLRIALEKIPPMAHECDKAARIAQAALDADDKAAR